MTMRRLLKLVVTIGVAFLAVSCGSLLGQPQAPSGPTIVNNLPAGDGGSSVLLGVLVVVSLLGVAAAAYLVPKLATANRELAEERKRRAEAEDMVVALTGQPMSHLTVSAARVYRTALAEPKGTEITHYQR